MLKTKLFPLLGITSIIATSTVTTSCSHSPFNLSGGSLSLNAISGDAGQDKAAWKLLSNDGEEITSGIVWNLIPATRAGLPDSIHIANGLVSWTDQITVGTYEFYVCASYKDNKINTKKITLSLSSDSSLVLKYDWEDLEEYLFYYDKSDSQEPKTPKNWYLFDEDKETIIPSFECEFYVNSFGYSSVFSIDKFGFLSWSDQIVTKSFNLQIICWYDNIRIASKIFTLIVFDELHSFHYILNDDKCSYTIFSYDKFDYGVYESLYVPSVYNNLPVTIIGDNFLSNCTEFYPKEFIIPETVNSIGDNFLSGCAAFNPTELFIIPETVNSIGAGLLHNCYSINCLKFLCSYAALESSELTFSVDDMSSKVYTNGLVIYLKSEQEHAGFISNFENICDSETKIFRKLIVVC